jgi:hypothetical protein
MKTIFFLEKFLSEDLDKEAFKVIIGKKLFDKAEYEDYKLEGYNAGIFDYQKESGDESKGIHIDLKFENGDEYNFTFDFYDMESAYKTVNRFVDFVFDFFEKGIAVEKVLSEWNGKHQYMYLDTDSENETVEYIKETGEIVMFGTEKELNNRTFASIYDLNMDAERQRDLVALGNHPDGIVCEWGFDHEAGKRNKLFVREGICMYDDITQKYILIEEVHTGI